MVHFVGAGPGDPELITVKGARFLSGADVVIYAGSLVDRELVSRYAHKAVVYDSSSMTLDETSEILAKADLEGLESVRLHTGDPSIYGAIQEQMVELDKLGLNYDVTPGVTAATAAAAALKQELTLPEVSQTVIITRIEGRTPVPEKESLKRCASLGATMVIYLSAGMLERVANELQEGGYSSETPVKVVSKASWKDQQIVEGNLSDMVIKCAVAGITRQAVIIVGDVLKANEKRLKAVSKLYDPSFAHGFRDLKTDICG